MRQVLVAYIVEVLLKQRPTVAGSRRLSELLLRKWLETIVMAVPDHPQQMSYCRVIFNIDEFAGEECFYEWIRRTRGESEVGTAGRRGPDLPKLIQCDLDMPRLPAHSCHIPCVVVR
ncbi:hypothetical protein J6590_065483 [Homalodisca vitripennis]|nr:hypothetical protein J6590_065483 [Homalodisca vitripennis]